MAIQQVQNPPDMGKRSGGGFWGKVGSLAGTGLGAAVGAMAGNPMAGAAIGGTVGGMTGGYAGDKLDPGRAGGERPQVSTVQGKKLDIAMKVPEVQMAQMQRSKELLSKSNLPNAMEYMKQLDMAQMKLKEQLAAANGSMMG